MGASVKVIQVSNQGQMENAVRSYIAQGFVIANQTTTSTTMMKKKEFSVLWAIVGLVLCILPLLAYLIIYSVQSDQMVEIRLVTPEATSQAQAVPPAPRVGAFPASTESLPPPSAPSLATPDGPDEEQRPLDT